MKDTQHNQILIEVWLEVTVLILVLLKWDQIPARLFAICSFWLKITFSFLPPPLLPSLLQGFEDTVSWMVLQQREESLQEVRQRQGFEDPV